MKPQLVQLDQSGPDWHTWRDQGIGASEAAAVLGDSPWMSSDMLAEVKLGLRTVPENEAMLRGKRLEPEARLMYQQIRGVEVRPICAVHPQHPWLRASLDGLSLDGKIVLEIKCPGKWPHFNTLRKRLVPSYYKAQLQHQLLVTGAEVVHYFSYRPDDPDVAPCALIEVLPDKRYQQKLFKAEQRWWRALELKKAEDYDLTEPVKE